jgi:hypothetical protein
MMTVEAALNGGAHGSPVGPLLRRGDVSFAAGLPPGEARLRPRSDADRTNAKGGSR